MLRDSLSRSNKRNAHTLLTDPKKAFSCAAFKALNLNKYLIASYVPHCLHTFTIDFRGRSVEFTINTHIRLHTCNLSNPIATDEITAPIMQSSHSTLCNITT